MQTLQGALDKSYLYRRALVDLYTLATVFFARPSSLRITRRYMTNV